jgi:outer membrane protein
MKALTVAALLCLTVFAARGVAQAPQTPSATPPAVQTPAAPAAPAKPAAQPPAATKGFPEGAKHAIINIQAVASDSIEGKASTLKVQALNQKKVNELEAKNKQLETAQNKLRQGASVMNEDARAQLQRDIDKMQLEIQRFTQDAQTEVQDLQQQLQLEFQKKLGPIIQQVANERGLQVLFSQADAGIVWADPSLDLTAEVLKRFDASAAPSPKPAAASKPPAGK